MLSLASPLINSSRGALKPDKVPRGKWRRKWRINLHPRALQATEDNTHEKEHQEEDSSPLLTGTCRSKRGMRTLNPWNGEHDFSSLKTSELHTLPQIIRLHIRDREESTEVTEAEHVEP
ncbi:hypothetical protein V6N13_130559 [Hibiscus sabdariffa]|uniref:Uncharacterized protein n=2 Tax=Hibiscus sabdariffa TaxID=183260 RepID=A0ABR2ANH4_9ROSI